MNIWDRIEKRGPDDCWPWLMGTNAYGYGVSNYEGKVQIVTRIVWRLTHGESPGALCVCHTCDNRICCNPAHFFLGTRADNLRDMYAKGRFRGGNWKISDETVEQIRAAVGMTQTKIAEKFGVSNASVSLIRNNKHRVLPRVQHGTSRAA